MDTFRVEFPQPQVVENEEEFVTNSGRTIKRNGTSNRAHVDKHLLQGNDDMLRSGVSVISPGLLKASEDKDQELSNSVQAQLHLSLDRLSASYDRDDIKRLQEKSKENKEKLSSIRSRKESGKSPEEMEPASGEARKGGIPGLFGCMCDPPLTGDVEEMRLKQGESMTKDSLDPVSYSQSQSESEQASARPRTYQDADDDDDIHTVVGDSLDASSREGTTEKVIRSSSRSSQISGAANSRRTPSEKEDKYADLRYNPNWKNEVQSREETDKLEQTTKPLVVDFRKAPRMMVLDSLDGSHPPQAQQEGGSIHVHKRLFSPTVASPVRLSTDVTQMKKTNSEYEDEFNKMLEAEILSKAAGQESQQTENGKPQNMQNGSVVESPKEPPSVDRAILIRPLEEHQLRPPILPEEKPLLGGYRALPERHRMPTPSQGPYPSYPVQGGDISPRMDQGSQRFKQPPEMFPTDGKDALYALSPRSKHRVHMAPVPPRFSKPKTQTDYIELNKYRATRKTNSAGYLDLHTKRVRKIEELKSRSQSELKGALKKTSFDNDQAIYPIEDEETPTGTVEEIWLKQAERLKIAKGERLNRGKVRPSPQRMQKDSPQGATFLVSPKGPMRSWEANGTIQTHGGHASYANVIDQDEGGLYSRLYEQNNRELFHDVSPARPPLPVPSQQNGYFPSPAFTNRLPPSQEVLRDSLNEDQYKKMEMSPMQHRSPLMKAYHYNYGPDAANNLAARDVSPRRGFSDQNLTLPHHPELWTNPDTRDQSTLPPSSISGSKLNRRVTFLGDDESLAIEGLSEELQHPGGYDLNKYRLPLPPTPPAKSQHHMFPTSPNKESLGKENISYDDYYDVKQGSYPVLPPILKSPGKKSPLKASPNGKNPSPDGTSEDLGSYLQQHQNQRRKFKYKKYTITDYRNLKKDVRLGGLGPDLASVRNKLEKADRAKQYAEFIRKQHMTNAVIKTKSFPDVGEWDESEHIPYDDHHHFSTTMDDNLRKQQYERRRRALDYSRQVPRPKVKQQPVYQQGDSAQTQSNSALSYNQSAMSDGSSPPLNNDNVDLQWSLLQMLKERHEREKAQVATFTGNS